MMGDSANKTFTVAVRNEALQSGNFVGPFTTLEDARIYCINKCKRCRKYMKYQICEGTPENPGKDLVGDLYSGAA